MRHSLTDTRRRRRRLVTAGAVAVAGCWAFYFPALVVFNFGTIKAEDNDEQIAVTRPPQAAPNEEGKVPYNILLMGSDIRSGENEDIAGYVAGMRSDTTMLLHLNADRTEAVVISFPRDSMVDIPECTRSDGTRTEPQFTQFNLAFALGGVDYDIGDAAACAINTVEAVTGVHVDAWAVIDFEGVVNMVDALGGVEMDIPARIAAPKADLFLDPGVQILFGKDALGFARLRTGQGTTTGSDYERIGRQQELISNIFDTALEKNLLTEVGQLTSFIEAGAGSLTVDVELKDPGLLAGLAADLNRIGSDNIIYVTVPWEDYPPNHNWGLWTPAAYELFDAVANDDPVSALDIEERYLGGS